MLFVSEIETQERRLNTSVLESEIIPCVFKSYLEKIDREKQKWEICMFCKKKKTTKSFPLVALHQCYAKTNNILW